MLSNYRKTIFSNTPKQSTYFIYRNAIKQMCFEITVLIKYFKIKLEIYINLFAQTIKFLLKMFVDKSLFKIKCVSLRIIS